MPQSTPAAPRCLWSAALVSLSLIAGFVTPPCVADPVPIFVNFRTSQVTAGTTPAVATTSTVAPPPSGWAYSAAAPVAGSTWNQILRPNPGIASGVGATAGTFIANSANGISLTDANGNATTVKLTAAIIIGDTTGSTRTEPSTGSGPGTGVLEPVGLCDQAWRIYSGANTTLFTFSGLPASRHYYVYCYGECGTSGSKFNVPAAYLAPGETASKSTTAGNSGNLFVFDGTNYSLYSGTSVLWVRFHVITDAAGNLGVGTAKNSSNAQFFNGFQLMPFPVPTISLQPPATVAAMTGSSVTISVTAAGDGTVSYAWRKNGTPIDPATNPSASTSLLTLANIQAGDAATYDVVVSNEGGSVTSTAAVVTVGSSAVAPSISIAPASQTASTGGSIAFSVSANGTAPLTYTWQKSADNVTFLDLPNSNSVQLSLTNLHTADAGYYRVRVSNSVGSVTSAAATLAIAPVITSQPVGGTVPPGAATTLSVGVDAGAGAPFATTYVWKRNGVVVTDGAGIQGSATATLQFSSFALANSGVYTVSASNPAGTVTSNSVYLGTPTSLTSTLWPAANATGVNRDTPPTIRFSGTPVVGTTGQVRIYDAANDTLVETIDLATLSTKVGGVATYRYASRTIGDRAYYYFPVVVVGNEARIALKSSTELAYNKTYYVQIDPGVLLDASGASFPGINDKTTWRFTTKVSGLANTATAITVAADGTGDFTTLQGAIDLIPYSPANTVLRTITVKPGIYNEEINLRVGQNNVTINGSGRGNTIIQYLNNNDLLPPGSDFSSRAVFRDETTKLAISDVTVRNLTLHGGGQAEAIAIRGSLATISRCAFYSFQDTLFLNQQIFVTDCYVEGDTDFIWGGNALFQRCELKMMNPGWDSNPRNSATQLGYIFVNCVFSRASTTAVPNGSGWFSRDFGASSVMFALFNCAVDKHINPLGWSVSATDLSAVRYWEYNSTNLDGTAYDISGRPTWNHLSTGAPGASPVLDHQQVDAATAAYYSNPAVAIGFTPAIAPVIDTAPTSLTLDAGATAQFAVGATAGYPAATYRWYKDGVAIDLASNPSAATARLSLSNAQVSDMGVYSVVVSNSAGTVTSSSAALAINGQPPVIYKQPSGLLVAPGGQATLGAQAIGAGALTYQWKFNGTSLTDGTAADGTIITGTQTATLALANVQLGHDGTYTVDVGNSIGVTASVPAVVAVDALPTIVAQPSSQLVTSGSSVTFSAGATGVTTIWYQWQKNGVPISGATTPTLTLSGVSAADSATYTVVVSSRAGSVTSTAAALTVAGFALPSIPGNAFDVTAFGAVGDNATDNTPAIQAALDAATAAGGGTVSIPAGTFLCGPINVRSNTNLFLASGCILRMLPMGQWPNAPYTSGTTPNFISVVGVHDAMVSGSGTIDGQGQAWWDRVDGTNGVTKQATVRPACAINIESTTNAVLAGVSFLNTPNINVGVGKTSRYVVVANITITEPADSPNTDGIHIAGQDLLIDHCTVNNGDDDIVINSGNSGPETARVTITNCTIGTGHGCSMGSFTSASGKGIHDVTISGLTFNGTTAGINLKSEPGRGGVVQNVTYSNIVMNNVGSAVSFSSYYGTVGSSGATGSNRITPAVVAAYNANPPTSLALPFLPEWKNIAISNLTINNPGGYSVLWGLPNKPVNGVTFTNITQNGGYGFELYNAAGIRFTGKNTFNLNAGQPTFTTYNAEVITSEPQDVTIGNGQSATFTAAVLGASGVNAVAPTLQWTFRGQPLVDGIQADGSVVSGSTSATLSITNARASEAGDYAVTVTTQLDSYDPVAGMLVPNSLAEVSTSDVAVLRFSSTPASVSVGNLNPTYDGTAKAPTITTSPAGLSVDVRYAAGAAPTAVGSYGFVATITDPNYVGAATGTLVIAPATPVISWSAPAPIVYGTPLGAAQLNASASTPGQFAYTPAAGTVLDAGADQPLKVTFTPTDTLNYTSASAATAITVNQAVATISLAPLQSTYDGTAKPVTATTNPVGLATRITYDGLSAAPVNAGSYLVQADIVDRNYTGSQTAALTIQRASASVEFGQLWQSYDGAPKTVSVTTAPAGLPVTITYDGSVAAPIYPGSHAVVAVIADPNYTGIGSTALSIVPTATVRHAPTLNGEVDGSVETLLGEDVTLNGSALVSGDLLCPGTPSVLVNGAAMLVGTKDGWGAATPTGYGVTLNGRATARYLVRRVDPVALSPIAPPIAPAGTRNVILTSPRDPVVDMGTIRNLTLRGTAGDVFVPPGAYGDFSASGTTAFVLGRAEATEPDIYSLQSLNLNGAALKVAGPVRLVVANGVTINAGTVAGASAHPDWLRIEIVNGGLTMNGGTTVYGSVTAPSGSVIIDGSAALHGQVSADRLTINGSGALIDVPLK